VLRNECPWFKDAPMPESVKGSRWQQPVCRCYVRRQPMTPKHAALIAMGAQHKGGEKSGLHQSGHTEPRAADPECPQCQGTGRLEEWVLRKGAWRHTRATESIFMLAKTMDYWSDGEAIREEVQDWGARDRSKSKHSVEAFRSAGQVPHAGLTDGDWSSRGRNPRNTLREPPSATADLRALLQWLQAEAPEVLDAYREAQTNPVNVVRPKSSQLDLPHYASFPPSLIEQFIKASVPAKCCPTCGAGFAPIIEQQATRAYRTNNDWQAGRASVNHHGPSRPGGFYDGPATVHGYAPTCTHYCPCGPLAPEPGLLVSPTVPCPRCGKHQLSYWRAGIVADCFGGSATTASVARALGRRSIVMDASAYYTRELMRERLGLADLARWEGTARAMAQYGAEAGVKHLEKYDDLPLFSDQ
jgi:hypothetical protein